MTEPELARLQRQYRVASDKSGSATSGPTTSTTPPWPGGSPHTAPCGGAASNSATQPYEERGDTAEQIARNRANRSSSETRVQERSPKPSTRVELQQKPGCGNRHAVAPVGASPRSGSGRGQAGRPGSERSRHGGPDDLVTPLVTVSVAVMDTRSTTRGGLAVRQRRGAGAVLGSVYFRGGAECWISLGGIESDGGYTRFRSASLGVVAATAGRRSPTAACSRNRWSATAAMSGAVSGPTTWRSERKRRTWPTPSDGAAGRATPAADHANGPRCPMRCVTQPEPATTSFSTSC